jgi:hypothetical protein
MVSPIEAVMTFSGVGASMTRRCYMEACDYPYFNLTANETHGASSVTGSNYLYGAIQRHELEQVGLYGDSQLYNKISKSSNTCTVGTQTRYETLCSGTPKVRCGTSKKFTSNGCSSETYTAPGGIEVTGTDFGSCVCDTSNGSYTSEADCNSNLSTKTCGEREGAECQYDNGCYVAKCVEKYFKITFDGSGNGCYQYPAYMWIATAVDGSGSILYTNDYHVREKYVASTTAEPLSGALCVGRTQYGSNGNNTFWSVIPSWTIYHSDGGRAVRTVNSGNGTTIVRGVGGDLNAECISYTFEAGERYVVKPTCQKDPKD